MKKSFSGRFLRKVINFLWQRRVCDVLMSGISIFRHGLLMRRESGISKPRKTDKKMVRNGNLVLEAPASLLLRLAHTDFLIYWSSSVPENTRLPLFISRVRESLFSGSSWLTFLKCGPLRQGKRLRAHWTFAALYKYVLAVHEGIDNRAADREREQSEANAGRDALSRVFIDLVPKNHECVRRPAEYERHNNSDGHLESLSSSAGQKFGALVRLRTFRARRSNLRSRTSCRISRVCFVSNGDGDMALKWRISIPLDVHTRWSETRGFWGIDQANGQALDICTTGTDFECNLRSAVDRVSK